MILSLTLKTLDEISCTRCAIPYEYFLYIFTSFCFAEDVVICFPNYCNLAVLICIVIFFLVKVPPIVFQIAIIPPFYQC